MSEAWLEELKEKMSPGPWYIRQLDCGATPRFDIAGGGTRTWTLARMYTDETDARVLSAAWTLIPLLEAAINEHSLWGHGYVRCCELGMAISQAKRVLRREEETSGA